MPVCYMTDTGAFVLPQLQVSPQVADNLFECFKLVDVLIFEGEPTKEKECRLKRVESSSKWMPLKFHGSLVM